MEKSLSDLADRLNEKIFEFEDFLRGMDLGVTAEVKIDPQTPLVFVKTPRDGFRLKVCPCGGGEMPLAHASREVRIRAVNFFLDLVEELKCNAEREEERLSEAIDKVDSLLTRLVNEEDDREASG